MCAGARSRMGISSDYRRSDSRSGWRLGARAPRSTTCGASSGASGFGRPERFLSPEELGRLGIKEGNLYVCWARSRMGILSDCGRSRGRSGWRLDSRRPDPHPAAHLREPLGWGGWIQPAGGREATQAYTQSSTTQRYVRTCRRIRHGQQWIGFRNESPLAWRRVRTPTVIENLIRGTNNSSLRPFKIRDSRTTSARGNL